MFLYPMKMFHLYPLTLWLLSHHLRSFGDGWATAYFFWVTLQIRFDFFFWFHIPTQRCHCQWIIRRYFHEWSHVNCDTMLLNIVLRCLVDNGSALVFRIAWCGISDDSSSKTRGFSELYIRHQGHSELIRLDCLTNDPNNWTHWLKPWIKRLIQGHDYFNHRSTMVLQSHITRGT